MFFGKNVTETITELTSFKDFKVNIYNATRSDGILCVNLVNGFNRTQESRVYAVDTDKSISEAVLLDHHFVRSGHGVELLYQLGKGVTLLVIEDRGGLKEVISEDEFFTEDGEFRDGINYTKARICITYPPYLNYNYDDSNS